MSRGHGPDDRNEAGPAVLLFALLLAVYATLLVRTAWVCDDAYITFRVVDNLWHGYGLRWNVDDRVQAFTHPLWMMLMAAAYGLTRDVYYTSLVVSMALSLGVAWLVVSRLAITRAHAVLALWTLILSKAFVDYSTGGLENPLQHLLLATFAGQYFVGPPDRRRLSRLAILAGLSGLNRLDSLLLVLPPLLAASLGTPWRRLARAYALGFLPLAAWMGFAFFYYGFPLPNTAYAKLNTGIPASELAAQGLYYLFNSLSIDPLTLAVVLLALGLPLARGPAAALPFAAGILLYLAYVVRIGGDFMAGRFLAAPLLAAVIVLARVPWPFAPLPFALVFVTLGTVALSSPVPNLTTTAFFFTDRWERRTLLDERGITDERAIYYRYTGLLTARRGEPMPNHHRAVQGRLLRAQEQPLFEHGQIGILAYSAGPGVHILDGNALADAFLARLPARPGWRIGHFGRRIPLGYEGSLRKGVNRLADPALRAFYRRISLLTRGALTSPERLAAIWDLNFGAGRHAIDEYFASQAGVRHATLASLSEPKPDGHDPTQGTLRFSEWGLEVALGRVRHPLAIELSLDQNDVYRLSCVKQGVTLAEREIPPRLTPDGGLSLRRIELDRTTARYGCDVLRIVPLAGDLDYSIGHVAILDELSPEQLSAPELAPTAPEPSASQAEPAEPEPPDEGKDRQQDDRLPRGR